MFDISRKMALASLAAFLIGAGGEPAEVQSFTPSRFSVEVRGEGPDVILIPGLGSSREVWAAQAEQLAASHRLHLVQVSGFAGQPVGAPAGEVIAPLVGELARYIEANGLERPAVIGHSMGGLTGLMLARTHPQRVGRLLIVDALPFFSAMFGPQVTAASAEPQARAMRDQIAAMDDATFTAQQNMGVGRLVKTEARRAEVVAWSVASDRATFAQAMYEVMTTDMRGEVANVQTPLTIVYAYDPVMGPEARIDGSIAAGTRRRPVSASCASTGRFISSCSTSRRRSRPRCGISSAKAGGGRLIAMAGAVTRPPWPTRLPAVSRT